MFDNLRAEMARNKKTIKDLSELLGISQTAFGFKLNGKTQFTLKEMFTIAKEFDCSIDYLAGFKRNTPPNAA